MNPNEKTHGATGAQNGDIDTRGPQSGFADQGGATGHETEGAEGDNRAKPTSSEPPRNLDTDRGGAYDRGNGGFTGGSGKR